MPRRQSSGGFPRAARRLTAWALGPGASTLAGLGGLSFTSSTTAILGAGVTPVIPNLTIVRIRGMITFELTTSDAALSGYAFTAAIGMVTADAFAVGASAVPDPFDDQEWPGWLWTKTVDIRSEFGAAAIGDPSVNPL